VNGNSLSAPLTVKMDPRVKVSPADLQQKFDLGIKISSAITQSSQAVNQARSVHEQLQDIAKSAPAGLREAVKGADTRDSELLDGPKEPSSSAETGVALSSLSDDLLSFYKEVEKSDGAPTTSQTTAANLLNDKLAQSVKAWDGFKTNELTKLNEKLHSAGLAEIRLDLPPREPEHAHNEE
jgi:hypothetical protein